jgi:hypothetical protein
MMKTLLGLLLLFLPIVAVAQNAIEGTWRVDLSKAQFDTKPIVLELNGGMYTCSSCDPKIMVKANGRDQKVIGSPYIDTLSVKVMSPNTIERIAKKDGQVRSRDTLTLSEDGMTLTETHMGHPSGASDQTVNWTGTFARVGEPEMGAHAVSGQWKVDNYTSASNNVLTFRYASEGDGLRFKADTGETCTASFDGKEYPFHGDPGTTSVMLKQIDSNTFEETYLRDGQVTGRSQMTISPDGNSMTIVSVDKRMGRTDTWVAEKESGGATEAEK